MSRASVRWWSLCLCLLLTSPLAAQAPSPLETMKDQADDAYRQRDFSKAIEILNKVLSQSPKDHEALYLRGSSRVEMGIETGNVNLVREGINDARDAIGAEGAGKTTGKPEYYLPYIYGMSHLANLENKPSHAKTALSVADKELDRDDLTPEQRANLFFQRAQANMQLKDYPGAEADLNEAIRLVPNHLAAHLMTADVAVKAKSPAEAVAVYSRIVQAFPEDPVVYNNRGMYLQSLGRSQEALADYAKAIQLNNKFIPAYINRGYVYLENGDPATAETALSEVVAIDPSQVGALNLRAQARMSQGKITESLTDYRKIVEMAPGHPMPLADLGFALFFAGDYANALASFNSALKLQPSMRFLEPWKLACEIRTSPNGQPNPAPYQAALAKPEGSRDWPDSLILFQLGQVDATKLLNSIHPTDENARAAQLCEGYYFIGNELQRRGREADAVNYWRQAIQKKLPALSAYRGAMIGIKKAEGAVR
ncbi:tetratricopeptide repeat protein [Planctomicrobium sp. SH664]|uniref:tetratricopeptide repeat protein n=1 Tax=Planctomicrobium sp. SH664 TaxID=3448125 RepID=UPI003F5BD7ED